jgi:hypothetical protein
MEQGVICCVKPSVQDGSANKIQCFATPALFLHLSYGGCLAGAACPANSPSQFASPGLAVYFISGDFIAVNDRGIKKVVCFRI